MLEELDPFFLNPTVGNKTKEILSSLNIPLLDYQSLLVDYEDLSIINQLHSTLYKTAYKAFYQQKIVLAEVYNLIYPPKDSATVGQINGASQMLATDDGKISLMIQLSIRKALSHEYFVGLLGVGYFQYHVDQPVQILVLSEYHEKNLDDIIRLEREEGYTSSWKEKLTWMKEILSGLLLLEKYSISIKDLTSNNIFFNNQLKIKMKPEYEIINSKQPVVASEEEKNSRRPSATTPSHVVFNIGKIIFYMLTGITFQDYCSSSSSSSVASPSIEAAPVSDGCPEALRSLMLKCLEYQQARSLTTETLTIQTIWKELDNIWNTTFPPENPSNQLLKRLSLTSASASKLITMRSTSSDSHSGFNPFDDLEDFHNRVDRDRYYQDGMMSHRPSVVPRRPTVPSQDAMDHMFSHFSHLPPRHSHAQQHSHPYQHRRPSTHVNPHHSNNPFSSNDTSPLLSPTTLHLPPSVPNSHSHSSNTHAPSVYFDRREDILQHVINSLGRQFHIIESDLHENLELVENLYIVEASPRGINAEEKIKKKEEVKNFRQNIESFFHQVENIKKQLVFLYLYCDLEEEPEKELRSSIKKTNENPSTSDNPFLAFEQNEASRRQSQLKLLQLLQEILNDNPTSTTAPQQPLPPSTEDIYEFYRRNSHSLAPKEMKRRLSLLRQETTSTATNTSSEVTPPPSKGNSTSNSQRNSSALLSSPSLPPSNAPVMKGSKPDRSMSSGSDRAEGTAKEVNKAEEVRKSVAPKVEKKPLTAVKGDFLAEIRKKSVSSEEPPNVPAISLTPKESFTLPAPEVQKTETEVIESKPKAPSLKPAVSLSARLFNQLDEPMTTEDLASTAADPVTSAPAPPLSPPLTVTSSVPEKPKTAQKTSGGHVRRTSSYEALTQFNRGKTENIAPTEPGNNTKALQTTVAPPAVPSHPANGASAGNSKISGLVVGRKNSLIPLDNNTAAQMKQRKASLYLGNKPSEGDQQMTLESASGDMSLPSNSGFYSNSSPMGKIFGGTFQQEQLDDYNFDNSNNIIPFSASTTPSAAVTSKPPSNAPSGPIHFIYGRQISGNQGPPSPSPDSPSHPLAARKNPIEKATEFINRVKQLDSMYLTRAHDPYDETLTNRDPALAEELLNSNTSYLHQHTFTGALNRPTNSTEGGSKKEHLTTALTSFLKVIEKCQDTSSKAKNLVHQMDQGINQIGISNNTGSLGSGTVASSGGRGTGGVRSVSPTTLPRHMSPTYSASRKLSPKAIQKANARVNTLSSTFAPSDSLHGRRPVSPASTLSGSVTNSGRRTVGGGLNMNTGRNFFDNDEPNPLTNSFQSLYNVNNNTATMNASVNSYGRSSSPSKDRAKSPRIRYSIHQEKLSKNKSPVTYSFSPSKRR